MTAAPPRQPSGLWKSLASLVLFVLVGTGHLLPAFHFALVVHRVCAEHGELVHDVASSSVQRREPDGSALVAMAEDGHEHEHCGMAARTAAGLAIAPSAVSGSALQYAGVALGAERGAHRGIALLAYAPKLAPPAAIA